MARSTRTLPFALALPVALLLGACERNSTDVEDDHDEFATVEVIDRGQTSQPVIATWTADGGWTGSLPAIVLSSDNPRITLGFRVLSDDGDELALSEDDEGIRYALAAAAPQGILDLDRDDADLFHGDHVYLYGEAAGTTRVQFVLWHLDHADDATDPIDVTVVN